MFVDGRGLIRMKDPRACIFRPGEVKCMLSYELQPNVFTRNIAWVKAVAEPAATH